MKTNSLILNVFAVIMAFGMTLSTLGIITSTSVETLEFSLFNFFAWFIGGLVVIFIYIKYFEK